MRGIFRKIELFVRLRGTYNRYEVFTRPGDFFLELYGNYSFDLPMYYELCSFIWQNGSPSLYEVIRAHLS